MVPAAGLPRQLQRPGFGAVQWRLARAARPAPRGCQGRPLTP